MFPRADAISGGKKVNLNGIPLIQMHLKSSICPNLQLLTVLELLIKEHHQILCLSDGNIPHSCSVWNGMCVCG